MEFYRTPDIHFEGLKGYPFTPHYLDIDGMRMHFVDEGARDAAPILMLHGEPSWSYEFRHMIPVCAAAGHRVIAPDFFGFGKSDKPKRLGDYSYRSHVGWMRSFVEALDLRAITLVCHDWGSLIGLRLAAENHERFDRIVVANGALATGHEKVPKIFYLWKFFALYSPWFPIDRIIDGGCNKELDDDELRAYRAPFPSIEYKVGARAFPKLVPISPQDPAVPANLRAWDVLEKWNKPFLTAFSDGDPVMRGRDKIFHELVPGARRRRHPTLHGGHFIQEDAGPEFASVVVDFIEETNADFGIV